jgi:uncharacterized metal-binding protein YceD (DUF177 family)
MKIGFDKVGNSPKPFNLTIRNINFEGTLLKKDYHKVLLDGTILGSLNLICDRCGIEYQENIDSRLNLTLSDRLVETEDDLDIIEFIDAIIDLDFILESEIASIENTYHTCKKCENDTTEFEKEF